MLTYHGTTATAANSLAANPSSVSVSVGGGELGQGFYSGDSPALAAAWAQGRYPSNWAVLQIDLSTSAYVRLAVLTLNWSQVVNIWNQLKAAGTARAYRFGFDIVYGPLATYAHVGQHKFESASA